MALRNNLIQALSLYDTYVTHREGDKASDEGLTLMKEVFAGVADDDKGFVFSVFLQFLKDDGVGYDATQFV